MWFNKAKPYRRNERILLFVKPRTQIENTPAVVWHNNEDLTKLLPKIIKSTIMFLSEVLTNLKCVVYFKGFPGDSDFKAVFLE